MRENLRNTVLIFLIIVAVLGVIFGLNYFGYALTAFFQPKMEAVRRDTMIQSRAYSEATMREMYRLKLQYVQSKSNDEKDTIKAMIRHEMGSFDKERLPADLQVFLQQIGE